MARKRHTPEQIIRKLREAEVEMAVVAWITEPVGIDRVLAHRRNRGLVSPFEPRLGQCPLEIVGVVVEGLDRVPSERGERIRP